jgi:hypothetical protein
MKLRSILTLLICGFSANLAQAGDFDILRGVNSMSSDPLHSTFAWQFQYTEPLDDHFGFQYSYMNQGHFAEHHRDGFVFSLQTHTHVFSPQFTLSAALGPYLFADTFKPPVGNNSDVHGVGTVLSLAATWQTSSNLFFELESDVVKAGTFNTLGIQAGLGYHFGESSSSGSHSATAGESDETYKNEFSALAGMSVVNVIGNGRATATSIEYRRNVWGPLDLSVDAISEGKNELADRYGVAAEVWVKKNLLQNRLTLSIGGGPYVVTDRLKTNDDGMKDTKPFVAGIFSMSASYRISNHWDVRAMWHRPFTNYNRDSDIWLGGVGYQF